MGSEGGVSFQYTKNCTMFRKYEKWEYYEDLKKER